MRLRRILTAVGLVMVGVLGTTAFAGGDGGGFGGVSPQAVSPQVVDVPGDTHETDYVAVEPCRIVDTRVAVGKFPAGVTRSYLVAGDSPTGFTAQGGKDNGCGIPEGASAVHANFISDQGSGRGFIRAWAWESPATSAPQASILNYRTETIGNAVTVPLCDQESETCTRDIFVKNFNASTHLVIDVLGYYIAPMWALVNADGTIADGSRVVVEDTGGAGEYIVGWDRDVTGCTADAVVSYQGAFTYAGAGGFADTYPQAVGVGANEIPVATRTATATVAALPFTIVVHC